MPSPRRLVILGTGWGSYSVMRNVSKEMYRVIVISPRNHFLFTPLLASTTVGTLEFRSIIEPVRNRGFRRSEDYHLSEAVSWDPMKKVVGCRSVLNPDKNYSVPYDKLVIGVGALPNTFGVPGVKEHAFFLKEVSDARAIRARLLRNFELSLLPDTSPEERFRLLHTVIVGGGPTGVEFGSELYDFFEQDMTRLYKDRRESFKVTLIESREILAAFDTRLRVYAEKKISQRKHFILEKASVKEVKEDGVVLGDGSFLPCGLVVWSTGLGPSEFTAGISTEKNNSGQIITDSHLRVISDQSGNSFAIGDCADIQGMALPCTAQVAERQGRYLAKALNESFGSVQTKPFTFRSMGMLAYIGQYQGLSDLPEFKLRGFVSWFLWRSAYLTRLGSWRLRMQVPLDWLKTLLYGRDTSRF